MRKSRSSKGKKKKRVMAGVLTLCTALGMTGCGKGEEDFVELSQGVKNLMEGIEVQAAEKKTPTAEELIGVVDFSVELLQKCIEEDAGKNTILSPTSVLFALAMTANGANGNTLAQMEDVLGMSLEELNTTLPGALCEKSGEKYKLNLANSIWFTQERGFEANQEFLQTNAEYYGAEIYQTEFNDEAKKVINAWVKDETDGMIEDILDEIASDAIMYLVNAVAFDAEWQRIYFDFNVHEGTFTNEKGETQDAEFMHSEEGCYLQDEHATGMLKYYADRKYAFVAMLPEKGMSVADYVKTLDGAGIQKMLADKESTIVKVRLPKFTCESAYSMVDILKELGMSDAFGLEADFTGMGTVPPERIIHINRVLHKAKIEVNERGTKAGAATIVEMTDGAAMPPERMMEVYLDRPFVYMIIDCENNLPVFMGTVMDLH